MKTITQQDLLAWKRNAHCFRRCPHVRPEMGIVTWYVYFAQLSHTARHVLIRMNSETGSRAILYDGHDEELAIHTFNANVGAVSPIDGDFGDSSRPFLDTVTDPLPRA